MSWLLSKFSREGSEVREGTAVGMEGVTNIIDNENIVLSIYRDKTGSMYVGFKDRETPSKNITISAEAVFKVAGMVEEVFDSPKNAGVPVGVVN